MNFRWQLLFLLFAPFSGFAQENALKGDENVLKAYFLKDAAPSEVFVYGSKLESDHLYYPPTPIAALPSKWIGSGIRCKKTKESFSFVCVGAPVEGSVEPSCNFLRAVYHREDLNETFAFGGIYRAADSNLSASIESLKEVTFGDGTKMLGNEYLSSHAKALTDQKGWNWIESPVRVNYHQFLQSIEDVQHMGFSGINGMPDEDVVSVWNKYPDVFKDDQIYFYMVKRKPHFER